MPSAEQLLMGRAEREVLHVTFPEGTLPEPFQKYTSGIIYRARPIPTLSLAIKKDEGPNEYFIASCLGDNFEIAPQEDSAKSNEKPSV